MNISLWSLRNTLSDGGSSVTYGNDLSGNGLYVGVRNLNSSGLTVITSPNGIDWTQRSAPNAGWLSVTYGNGLFVAVGTPNPATTTNYNSIMTSSNGVNWTLRSGPPMTQSWFAVTYGIADYTNTLPFWSAVGTNLSVSSYITALKFDLSGNLYAAGTGTSNLSMWNGSTWTRIGGLNANAPVNALAFDSNGNLYAGGSFTTMGEVSANRVARWNGSTWSAMGSGITNGTVKSLVFDSNGNLYVGGTFTSTGDVSANRVAMWNGSTWSALGSGLNNSVNALEIDLSGNLYAGGEFTTAGGVSALFIARWNGTSWSQVGSGMNNVVASLTKDLSGNLYAAGSFTTAGGVTANIARWNGSTWSRVGSSLSTGAIVYSLHIDLSGNFYIGGNFGGTGDRVLRLNGSTWSSLSSPVPGVTEIGSNIYGLATDSKGNLYVGGNFTYLGDTNQQVAATNIGVYYYNYTGTLNPNQLQSGLFVATGGSAVMTSSDGINWYQRLNPTVGSTPWRSVTYGNGLFVAIGSTGIMRSANGINWTYMNNSFNNYLDWRGITYGNGLFVAVAQTGTNRVMTSPDAINWTIQSASENSQWRSVSYGDGIYVAVAVSGTYRIMTSSDAINWIYTVAPSNSSTFVRQWNSVVYGNKLFVSIGVAGDTFAAMTATTVAPTLSYSIPVKIYTDPPYSIKPTSNSNGSFSYVNSNPTVATISGDIATIQEVGTAIITASQAASFDYTPSAADVSANLIVNQAPPTITNFSVPTKTYLDAPFNIVDPSSNSPGSFSYESSNTSVADISGNTVTILAAGNSIITGTQAETKNFLSGDFSQNFIVNKANPTITNFSVPTQTFLNPPFDIVDPSSNSPGSFSYLSSNTSVADISGNTVTIVGAGNCVITARQATTPNFLARNVPVNFVVNKANPTITNFSVPTQTFLNPPFNIVDPSSNSPGSFSYISSDPSVCTIIGKTVTIVGAGNCVITATQATTANFLARDVSTNFIVNKANPTITNFSVPTKTYVDASFNIVDPSSNSPGSFSYISSDPSVCTIIGNTVTIVGAGNCVITATQSETNNFFFGDISSNFIVTKSSPTITNFSVPTQTFLNPPFDIVDPSSNSPGSFSYISSDPSVCTILGNTVTILAAGNCVITATQAETDNFLSGDVSTNFIVNKANPTITNFSVPTPQTFLNSPFDIEDPSSNSPGSFSYISSDPSVCSISGNTVTIVGAGNCVITATQAETNNFLSRDVSTNFIVNKANPTITNFSVPTPQTFLNLPFNLVDPSSNSPGSFSYISSDPSVCTINGNTVTIVGAGNCVITAIQAETNNFLTGDISANFFVDKANPTITNFSVPTKTYVDASFNIADPSSNSPGSFSYISSDASVCTIIGNTVTIVGAGNCVITATQAETNNFFSGDISSNFVVNKANPTITNFSVPTQTFGNAPFNIVDPSSNSPGSFSYISSDPSICSINGNTVTILAAGNCVITATQAATNNYNEGQNTTIFNVIQAIPTIGQLLIPPGTFGDSSFNIIDPSSNSSGSFSYISTDLSCATVSGNTITIVGAGSTTIFAVQSATTNYVSSGVQTTFIVNKATPVLSNFPNITKNFGDNSFNLVDPSSNSNGLFIYSSDNTNVAKINGNTVQIVGGGIATITAQQQSTNNYNSASIYCTLTVNRIMSTLSNFSIAQQTYSSNFLPFAINPPPQSNSNGAFIYTSSNTNVATVTPDGVITVVGAGSTDISANQQQTNNYFAASIQTTLLVQKAVPSLSGFTISTRMDSSLPFALTPPTTNSDGSFNYVSSNEDVATVDANGIVTVKEIGLTFITANLEETNNYVGGSIEARFEVVADVRQTYFYYDENYYYYGGSYSKTSDPSLNTGSYETNKLLTSVEIGSSALAIEDNCFSGQNVDLLIINIPTSVATLGNNCFNSTLQELRFTNAQSIQSVGPSCFANMRDGIKVYYDNVKDINGLPASLRDSQNQFVNPEIYYNNVLAIKFTSEKFTAPLTVETETNDPNVDYMEVVPNEGSLVVETDLEPLLSMSITALDSSGNPVTDLSNNPVQYSIELPGIPTTSEISMYKLDPSNTLVPLDPQPEGYPAILTYNEVTGLWDTSLPSLSDFAALSKLDPSLNNFSVPNKRVGDDDFVITPPSTLSDGSFNYTSSNENIATIVDGNKIHIVNTGVCTITATQTSTDIYNSASITSEFQVGPELFEYNNISDTMTVNISMIFTLNDASATLVLPLTGFTGRIFWGDGLTKEYTNRTNPTKTYTNAGTYTVSLVDVVSLPKMGQLALSSETLMYRNTLTEFNYLVQINSLTDLAGLFNSCINNVNFVVSSRDIVNNVTTMESMFQNANAFNRPLDLNTENVSNMTNMLNNASSFNQSLNLSPINSLTDASSMLDGTNMSGLNYSNLLILWGSQSQLISNVILGAQGRLYNNYALSTRNYLISSKNWSIIGDSLGPYPTLTNVTPSSGPAETLITITGSNFNYNPTVTLDNISLSIQNLTNTQIQCVIPSGLTAGIKLLTITTDIGYSTTNFTYVVVNQTTIILDQSLISGLYPIAPVQLAPISNSPAPFVYSSSNDLVATVDPSGLVTIVDSGSAIITVSQLATESYTSALKTLSVDVSGNITNLVVPQTSYTLNYSPTTFNLDASTNNSFTNILYSSDASNVATVDLDGNVTITGTGQCVITVSQPKIPGWSSASVDVSINVLENTTNLVVPQTSYTLSYPFIPFNLNASTNNPFTPIEYESSNDNIATVDLDGNVTITGTGQCVITVSQPPILGWTGASVDVSINALITQTVISAQQAYNINYTLNGTFTLDASSNSYATIQYNSSDLSVCSVDSLGLVTINDAGTCVITISQQPVLGYSAASINVDVTINPNTILTVPNTLVITTQNFNVDASSNNTVAPIQYSSSNLSVATVDQSGNVIIVGQGRALINVFQVKTGIWSSASTNVDLYTNTNIPIEVNNAQELNEIMGTNTQVIIIGNNIVLNNELLNQSSVLKILLINRDDTKLLFTNP
jgi:hypothetical protein